MTDTVDSASNARTLQQCMCDKRCHVSVTIKGGKGTDAVAKLVKDAIAMAVKSIAR